jgi:hypothetical protein
MYTSTQALTEHTDLRAVLPSLHHHKRVAALETAARAALLHVEAQVNP